jgi:hypothetical protein
MMVRNWGYVETCHIISDTASDSTWLNQMEPHISEEKSNVNPVCTESRDSAKSMVTLQD